MNVTSWAASTELCLSDLSEYRTLCRIVGRLSAVDMHQWVPKCDPGELMHYMPINNGTSQHS
eukprot:5377525-Prymnesium_polylepis.1